MIPYEGRKVLKSFILVKLVLLVKAIRNKNNRKYIDFSRYFLLLKYLMHFNVTLLKIKIRIRQTKDLLRITVVVRAV